MNKKKVRVGCQNIHHDGVLIGYSKINEIIYAVIECEDGFVRHYRIPGSFTIKVVLPNAEMEAEVVAKGRKEGLYL